MEKPYVICCLASTVSGGILAEQYFEKQEEHGLVFKQLCEGCKCDAYESNCLMLKGGDSINNSLLQAGLVDEVRILVLSLKGNIGNMPGDFETSSAFASIMVEKYKLIEVNPLDNNMVWLKYRLRNKN